MLKRAAEIEPDNFLVLERLLPLAEGFPPEAPEYGGVYEIDSGSIAAWREALYEAGLARAAWWLAAVGDAEPADVLAEAWRGVLYAGTSIRAAALREGNLAAAEAIRARLRRDLALVVEQT